MVHVNVDNFVRAETARMFDGSLVQLGGRLNEWFHHRLPVPMDAQVVIRTNRDTLYSAAMVDISEGATLTMPEADGRYMSTILINEDHYINKVIYDAGTYELTVDEYDTPYVFVLVRTLADPDDDADLAAAHALQDGLILEANAATPYTHPPYDEASRAATAEGLAMLARGVDDTFRMFGSKEHVDPVRHLIGTFNGWGGLPEQDAFYVLETEPRASGRFEMTFKDVPVNGFWSLSVYNEAGYFEPNPFDAYSLNNVTAKKNEDGSVTINLAPDGEGLENHLYVMDGWNYALRFYRPQPSILDGTWTPPVPIPVS